MPTPPKEFTDALIEQRIAEMSAEEFDALVTRTRPPAEPGGDDVRARISAKLATAYNRTD